ncbi:MAG: hypothetical protein AAF590_04170 [Pseudomonadota bacterium]
MPAETAIARRELVFRLRDYLGQLSTDSHRTLTRSIDRARSRGETSPVHSIIMDALRGVSDWQDPDARVMSAERAFFEPLTPIIISPPLPDKEVGLIDRASLRAIWSWITRDVVPDRCDGELAALRASVVEEEVEQILEYADDLRRTAFMHAAVIMEETEKNHGSLRRIEGQLGSARVLADLHDIMAFNQQLPMLNVFLSRLPEKMPVGRESLDKLQNAIKAYDERPNSDAIYAFAAVASRMGALSDLVRFAVFHANSGDPVIIRQTRAAGAVQIALAEATRLVERFRITLLEEADVGSVADTLKEFHELASAIKRTLDDTPNDPWLKRLSTIRERASEILAKELEPLPHLIRRSITVMESRGQEIIPDDASVDEAVFGIKLLMVARDVRGSLALNALIERVGKSVEDMLENQGKAAIDRLNTAGDDNWEAAEGRSKAAVRLFGVYHGGVYGQSMARRHAQTVQARKFAKAG